MQNTYWLTPVLLESGLNRAEDGTLSTETTEHHLLIRDGRIDRVSTSPPGVDGIPQIDGKGYLVLPSLYDHHVHLDKGFYGGPWKAATPFQSVADRIREEEQFLEAFLPTTPARAESLIDLLTSRGTTSARVHVNVDPVVGLGNVERIAGTLDRNKNRFKAELVAFPQHGLLREGVPELMDRALSSGVAVVGGLDPASIDRWIDASLHQMMALATKHDAPIDLHLHDRDTLGVYTIERLADLVEDAGWQGKVTISHAYCLGDRPIEEVRILGERMKALGMTLATTAPIDVPSPPVYELMHIGLDVRLVNDNIHDHWSPFGSGDLLQRASRTAEKFGRIDEANLRQTLGLITRGLLPLDDNGHRQWPKAGDPADLLLVDASCSAEAVARVPEKRMVIRSGKMIAS